MKLVYVAGRYRSKSKDGVRLNIQAASHVGAIASERGWYPVIPHMNTAGHEHITDNDDQFYLDGTLELMRRCDAVVMVPGWTESKGAISEHNEAQRLEMPIYLTVDELPSSKSVEAESAPSVLYELLTDEKVLKELVSHLYK